MSAPGEDDAISLRVHPCAACGQPVKVASKRQPGDPPVYCVGHEPKQQHPRKVGEWEAATLAKHEFEDSMIGPGGLAGAKIPLALIDDSKAMERFLRGDSNYQTTSAWVNGRDAWKAAVLWCRSVGFEPPERIMPNEPLPESVLDAAHVAHNEWWPTAGNADADPTTGEAFQAGVEWLASKLTGSEK